MKITSMVTSDSAIDHVKCPKCGGSGWIIFEQNIKDYCRENGKENIYGERDFTINVQKKCSYCSGGLPERVEQTKKSAGIPESFYDKRYSAFDWNIYRDERGELIDTTLTQKIVGSFIEQFGVWEKKGMSLYLFSGTKGAGKTFLASCICNELMNRLAIRTRFVNASDLISISQSGDKNSHDPYEREPLKLLYECKFLVIDDLGQKNTGSEWLEDILYKILDDRMNRGRLTLITSNITISNLPFDERLTDRIDKMCYSIALPEVSVRHKETGQNKVDLLKSVGLWKE